jgi:uncharacterized protein (DUF2336 family)
MAASVRDIERAVARAPAARRGKMLEQITTLFIDSAERYSDEEIGFFDEVITRLAAEIEREARILLSERLAPVPNAPPATIRMLAFDDDAAIATPVLSLSERLDEQTLIENANAKSQQHLLAIAGRRSLGESVTDILVARGDRAVAATVAGNPGARLSPAGFAALIGRAKGDDGLTERVGTRSDIPPHLFLKLLAVASEQVRTKLRARHPHAGTHIDQVVAQVARRMRRKIAAQPRDYSATSALLCARHRAGMLGEADLAAYAESGRMEESVVALALLAALPVPAADEALHGDRSDAVLVIARARGLAWPTVKALLRLRAGPKGISITEMQQNLASFERLSRSTAEQLLRFHSMGPASRPAKPS